MKLLYIIIAIAILTMIYNLGVSYGRYSIIKEASRVTKINLKPLIQKSMAQQELTDFADNMRAMQGQVK